MNEALNPVTTLRKILGKVKELGNVCSQPRLIATCRGFQDYPVAVGSSI